MEAASFVYVLAGAGLAIVFVMIAFVFFARRVVDDAETASGPVWRRGHSIASELAAGRDMNSKTDELIDFLDSTTDLDVAAESLAVAVRQHDDVHPRFFAAVALSGLPAALRHRLASSDPIDVVHALELVEVLVIHELLGDVAVLAKASDPRVVRAAVDAVVALDPSIGIGVLTGLAASTETWAMDALARAVDAVELEGSQPVPLMRKAWRESSVLARRALSESALHDRNTGAAAITMMAGALDDESAAKRLAAIQALASCIDHPSAQLALSGALGAPDRMTRFAAAATLCDHAVGRQVLRRMAHLDDGSDAATIAAEVLWRDDPMDQANGPSLAS